MVVGTLIAIMITVVVGVTLIPTIIGAVREVEVKVPTGEVNPAVGGLLDSVIFVFIAVIIFGAVAWIGGFSSREEGEGISWGWLVGVVGLVGRRNSFALRNEAYKQAKFLGINGAEIAKEYGLLPKVDAWVQPLGISGGVLQIDKNYSWYPVERLENSYKIVGLHRKDKGLNKVYLISKNRCNDITNKKHLKEV